jgi:hypothetical protein
MGGAPSGTNSGVTLSSGTGKGAFVRRVITGVKDLGENADSILMMHDLEASDQTLLEMI